MRYTVSTVSLCCVFVAICMALAMSSSAQSLHESVSYEVIPSCVSPTPDKPTLPNQFFYRLMISESSGEEHFEIVLDGDPIVQFNIDISELPYVRDIGPLPHSIVGGSYHQYILRSLTHEIADTLFLPEVVCGHGTDNGLHSSGYYCNGLEGGIVAQATPEVLSQPAIPEKMYTYILINRGTGLVEAKNFSGHFTQVTDLSNYEMHAFATSFEESANFINSIEVGQPLDQNDLVICYAFCGVFEVSTDCSSFDLRLQKESQEVTVYSYGDTAIFNITVINEGRVTAYNVRVRDNIPEGLIFEPSLNPEWNVDAISLIIDSIAATETYTIPIRLIVDPSASFIDIINTAEIISGTIAIDKDIDAFDRDSSPDNDIPTEDDQDDTEITIIENLCNSTFEVVLKKEPSCEGVDIIFEPEIMMANEPITWRWRYNGSVISREQILVLAEDVVDPLGRYELTAIDSMGCVNVMAVDVNMIKNDDRLSCYSDINVGVNANCQLNIHPAMLTSNRPPGIDDYEIKIEDVDGNKVDVNDISAYGPDDILMANLINPCTGEVLCWTNLHLENKLFPNFEIYSEEYETVCTNSDLSATEIIDQYNLSHSNQILSASEFQDSLRQNVCLQEWDVDINDLIVPGQDMCDDMTVIRIYQLYNQETPYPLDTAVLKIGSINLDDLILPEDVDNIACGDQINPSSLGSIPSYIIGNDTIRLDGIWQDDYTSSICNLGISYTDEVIVEHCVWGAKKIMRTWSLGDWCHNETRQHTQYLYIIDREAPIVTPQSDTVTLTTQPFQCHLEVNPSDYISITDNCTQSVSIIEGSEIVEIPLGFHEVTVAVTDPCQNTAVEHIVFHIVEATPPVAVLHEILTLNFATDTSSTNHHITASAFDAGSHDSQCGPVTISIARKSEIDLLESSGDVPVDDMMLLCGNYAVIDKNDNGILSESELFRSQVEICCTDIGRTISLLVVIEDESGNVTQAEVQLEVTAKLEWTVCDDGNPCTTDDRYYGDCGCSGQPIMSDIDQDGIQDCNDDIILLCYKGEQVEAVFSDIDSFLNMGAVGGVCENGDMALIAGEVRTPLGQPIEAVDIITNTVMVETTSSKGEYALPPQEMYKKYEMFPMKDDDPLNGVSAVDLVILQEYIIGLREIDDPYLLIAADVNGDGKVSANDVVDMQRLLLGQRDNWRGNRSWRFIIENFEWEDIRKPWSFEEINVISSLEKDMMDEDWIGVKTGDLNQDATPYREYSSSRSSDTYTLRSINKRLSKNERITVSIQTRDLQKTIHGLQVRFVLDKIAVRAINSGSFDISSRDYYVNMEDNTLTIAWANGEINDADDYLFSIEIEAQDDVEVQKAIKIEDRYPAIVVLENDKTASIALQFDEETSITAIEDKARMFQNQPNPFTGQTVIQFVIPEKGEVDFRFFASNGELLHERSGNYGSGNNAISLKHEDLRYYQGAIYYQMTFQDQTFTRTMVLTK